MNGLGHLFDELSRLYSLLCEGLIGYLVDTVHLEQLIIDVHGLGQSVGEEQDSSA